MGMPNIFKQGRGKETRRQSNPPKLRKSGTIPREVPKGRKQQTIDLECVLKAATAEYHNPDPIYRLIGPANEGKIQIDDTSCTALIDSGAQVSTITESFAKHLQLQVKTLKSLLSVEGTGGSRVPYHGYVEANLQIPGINAFNQDTIFLVINDSKYGEQVPIQIGTLHIDAIIEVMTEDEFKTLDNSWRRAKVS